MATVTGFTAERMLQIEKTTVTSGLVDPQGNLILSTREGSAINAGNVKGPKGDRGPEGGTPPGTVNMFAGASAPTGYLLCNGAAVSRTTYADLFAAIGTTYGAGNGTSTFNVPNVKGRVPVGLDSAQTEFDTLGETGGSKTHTLTTAEMPVHTHTQNPHSHTQNSHTHGQNPHSHTQQPHTHTQQSHTHDQNAHDHTMDTPRWLSGDTLSGGTMFAEPSNALQRRLDRPVKSSTATNQSATPTIDQATALTNDATATNTGATATNNSATAINQSAGSGQAHNNLQPYIVLNYIIKI